MPLPRILRHLDPPLPKPTAPEPASTAERASSLDPVEEVFLRNKAWAKEMRKEEGLLERLRQHKPKYLWIGCSDARVPASQLLALAPGEVFVHRNIAALVVNTDMNLMSVIAYAVDVLKVKDIIVCGHYECGGVRAAMQQTNHNPPLENWLRNIRDVVRLHRDQLRAIEDEEQRYRRLVELNTIEQTLNVFKTGVVQRARLQTRDDPDASCVTPRVHAVVYDPLELELVPLTVSFKEAIGEYEDVYRLYPRSQPAREGEDIADTSDDKLPEYFV